MTRCFPAQFPPYVGPCDILLRNGFIPVAAHSTTRKMRGAYKGAAFQIRRASDNATLDIYFVSNGLVNTKAIMDFANGTTWTFSNLYDQMNTASSGNNLPQATSANQPWGQYGILPGYKSLPAVTTQNALYLRNRTATVMMPLLDASITEYMVVSFFLTNAAAGTYGNMEATVADTGTGRMFALALSRGALGTVGTGTGPWGGTDLENGVWLYGATPTAAILTVASRWNKSTTTYSSKIADATAGVLLTTKSGAIPNSTTPHMEGGLSLGEGGDATAAPIRFFEGMIVAGATDDATDDAVQANIAAFYGAPSYGFVPPAAQFVNFTTAASLPFGITLTRASTATDGQYTDAAGRAFTIFSPGVPVFMSGLGLMVWESRTNFLLQSDAIVGTGAVTQTTGIIAIGNYVVFCNGSTGATIAVTAGTGVATGLGTLNANTSTYLSINVTTAGTFVATVAGTINWMDWQNVTSPNGAPSTHIPTAASTVTRAADSIALTGAWVTNLKLPVFTVLGEITILSKPASGGLCHLLNGATTPFTLSVQFSSNGVFSGLFGQSTVLAGTGIGAQGLPTAGTLCRIGATYNPSNYLVSLNGTQYGVGHNGASQSASATYLLGGGASSGFMNGLISKFATYPYILSDVVLRSKMTIGNPLP